MSSCTAASSVAPAWIAVANDSAGSGTVRIIRTVRPGSASGGRSSSCCTQNVALPTNSSATCTVPSNSATSPVVAERNAVELHRVCGRVTESQGMMTLPVGSWLVSLFSTAPPSNSGRACRSMSTVAAVGQTVPGEGSAAPGPTAERRRAARNANTERSSAPEWCETLGSDVTSHAGSKWAQLV